jgi:uncharacterized protein YjiS (DUF1127 family)
MQFESERLGDPINGPLCRFDVLDLTMAAVKGRRNAVIEDVRGYSPASSEKRLRDTIGDTRGSDAKLVCSWPTPETSCPSASEHHGCGRRSEDRDTAGRVETGLADFTGRRHWITPVTSFFAELFSRMRHAGEARRIRAAWEAIDDRTLKDIGVSRYEIEYAREARH